MTHNTTDNGPVFVVGCPRSGTTLMRDLLNTHPQLALLPYETHLFDRFIEDLHPDDLMDPARFDDFWQSFVSQTKFYRLGVDPIEIRDRWLAGPRPSPRDFFTFLMQTYAESEAKPRWGEKTPGHFRFVDRLFDWYPDARVIFVVRDPRAVLTSWLTLRNDWTRVTTAEIVEQWRDSVQATERWKHDPRTRVVVYEHLVTHLDAELAEIAAFLGVDHRSGQEELPVSADRVERWRTTLFPSEVRLVETRLGAEMVAWGYEPTDSIPSINTARAVMNRSMGWARWRLRRMVRARPSGSSGR